MSLVKHENQGSVAVIALQSPPVNALGYRLRGELVEQLESAIKDEQIQAIVLTGGEQLFCGGADISEFATGGAAVEPSLWSLDELIEHSPKPIVAAIGGSALGGGFEMAMACHYRVAMQDVSLGLPEVKLGILPGVGGTQRLPRLIGVEAALNMIVSGSIVKASLLAKTGLFDKLVKENVVQEAIEFAQEIGADIAKGKVSLRRTCDLKVEYPNHEAFFQFARNTVNMVSKGYPAPKKALECVAQAVTSPFAQGMQYEYDRLLELVGSSESRALVHAFFAERATQKIPGVSKDTSVRAIGSVAIVGAGTMGRGIAMSFINAGIPVTLLDMQQESLDRGVETIAKMYQDRVSKGKLKPEKMNENMALLQTTLEYADLSDTDLVIEAVFERMDIKEKVFKALDAVVKPGAILASNTSSLDLNKIASFTRRPEDVVGLHFFSPAHVMKLLEVVRGEKTSQEVMASIMKLAKKIRKVAVVSGVCDGFIGNRMLFPYLRQALFLLDEGAMPWQVDRALENFGMAMGPFKMSDLSGLDVLEMVKKSHAKTMPQAVYSGVGDGLVAAGRLGQKTGKGWYCYADGKKKPKPDTAVEEVIRAYRQKNNIKPRKISSSEIVERCVYALINEGAKILEEGIAIRASDIDVVYLYGYGFPPFRGGPMFYADTTGLYRMANKMTEFSANQHGEQTAFWQVAPMIKKLLKSGQTFSNQDQGGASK